ncbi:hypothetical protein ACM1RC_19855 [Paenibacillus azoreducens]
MHRVSPYKQVKRAAVSRLFFTPGCGAVGIGRRDTLSEADLVVSGLIDLV